MYRVIRAGILYYEDHMRGSKGRYELIEPLMLLVDTLRFKEAKTNNTKEYLDLCDIIAKIRVLYLTGEGRYHHFGVLLEELVILGFDIQDMMTVKITHEDILSDRIDLLMQFLAFRYPSEEYDNKTGVHDVKTNKFIFIQP